MKTSETHPIRLDFLRSAEYPILNRLGMTLAPGKKVRSADGDGWNRDLGSDLGRLKDLYKIDTLVSLVEPEELVRMGIEDLPEKCESARIELVQYRIKDGSTPAEVDGFARLIELILERLNGDSTVAVHCRGGLGRTGLTAACAIVAVSDGNIAARGAIEMTRHAREGAVETQGQEEFVNGFAERLEDT